MACRAYIRWGLCVGMLAVLSGIEEGWFVHTGVLVEEINDGPDSRTAARVSELNDLVGGKRSINGYQSRV